MSQLPISQLAPREMPKRKKKKKKKFKIKKDPTADSKETMHTSTVTHGVTSPVVKHSPVVVNIHPLLNIHMPDQIDRGVTNYKCGGHFDSR